MKKRILMLGCGVMQSVAIRSAKERGWEVVAVDGNPDAPSRNLADRFEAIDLKDVNGLIRLALSLKAEGGLDGVFTAATDFSASVAAVAERCGLPGHSLEAALNASDKLRMRECFRRSLVPSPSFVGIDRSSAPDAHAAMRDSGISFPVVVKPVDNMGARGCRKVGSIDELASALEDAIRFSRSGRAILEAYMDGPEFSLEALVFDGKIIMTGFADRHIEFPPYFVEMGHTMPSALKECDRSKIEDVFFSGIRALGLSHGVAKGDIKLTSAGPMIGEIAGRLSGGYMSGWTFPYASGIHLTGKALDLAVGMHPDGLDNTRHWTSAERAWISIPGKVRYVSGYEKARLIPYMRDIFPRIAPGDTVRFPMNNVEKCGNCLSAAPDREAAVQACSEAVRSIFVRLEPCNPETDAFLASSGSCREAYPPSAFSVPEVSDGETWKMIPDLAAFPVPESVSGFLDCTTDWHGCSLRRSIQDMCAYEPDLVRFLTECSLSLRLASWNALLRGGVQGIIYLYDSTIHA